MNIHKYVASLFLLLLGVAQASTTASLDPKVNVTDRLEQINADLETTRENFCKDFPNARLFEINNFALTKLNQEGYHRNHLLSMISGAISQRRLAFPKTLYPVTTQAWWKDGDSLALLLTKVLGCKEWMDEKEWEDWVSSEEWEEHVNTANWELHYRALIRFPNAIIYKNKKIRDSIFKNERFRKNFKKIIQDAYDSGNFTFLGIVPPPSEEYPLAVGDATLFWSLAYGETWCPKEWHDYIDTIVEIDVELRKLELFQTSNPKVFECERVREFLEREGISESLEMAVKFDSLSFAQYLEKKHGSEEFQKLAKACPETHTQGRFLEDCPYKGSYKYLYPTLSQVYNLLLDNGRDFDPTIITLRDLSILGGQYLERLLASGFKAGELFPSDLNALGKTTVGVEILRVILKNEHMLGNEPLEIRSDLFGYSFKLLILDVEVFQLIKELPSRYGSESSHLRDECTDLAIRRADMKFLTEAALLSGINYSGAKVVFHEAAEGNLTALDWILENTSEFLRKLDWAYLGRTYTPYYLPLLSYLFKRSSSYKFLAEYAEGHLWKAVEERNRDYYDQVIAIENLGEMMKEYKIDIPEFS